MFGLFGASPPTSYDERLGFAIARGIALWDVCGSAERLASADTTIFSLGDFNVVTFVSGGGPADSTHVLATLGIRYAFDVAQQRLGVARRQLERRRIGRDLLYPGQPRLSLDPRRGS